MAATYHENDENDLPDALHLDAFVVVRDRADDAVVVFFDDVVDVRRTTLGLKRGDGVQGENNMEAALSARQG